MERLALASLGIRTLEAIAADAWAGSGTVVRCLAGACKLLRQLTPDAGYTQRR